MRISTAIRILALAFFLAVSGVLALHQWQNLRNERLTTEICGFVGNYLEVGSLREAYEGLQQGLIRSGSPSACVSVIDNGRSAAPDCLDPEKAYQTTVCKAEGNTGVRAEIRYVLPPLFDKWLLLIWLVVSVVIYLVMMAIRAFASFLTGRLAQEIQDRLFDSEGKVKESGSLGAFVEWGAQRIGIVKGIKKQTDRFKTQIGEFETRVREEAALRARREAEAEKSKEYIEKVREIRHNIRSPLSSLLVIKDEIQADTQTSKTLASVIRMIQFLVNDLDQVDREKETPRLVIVEVVAEETVNVLRPKFFGRRTSSFQLTMVNDCRL